ncbi:MAG: hypothetical protein JWM33_1637, partial [Caulobacteraceae bacterium]|nr:hypothetical protein [Caulobacteraceae bacterium]
MEYIAGAVLALGVGFLATYARFDRDRAFYPTVLVVSASYYDLFAILSGGGLILGLETVGFCAFVVMAVIGFRTNLWLVVAALLGHGVLDVFHGSLVPNPGVPSWWPAFCLTFDLVAATNLASRMYLRGEEAPARERARAPRLAKTRVAWALVVLIGASPAPVLAAKAEGVRVASLEGRQVAYQVMGSGRPVMVLFSGLGDGMASFKDVAPRLAAHGTVILYDRAGYGRSAMGPETRDAASADRELS